MSSPSRRSTSKMDPVSNNQAELLTGSGDARKRTRSNARTDSVDKLSTTAAETPSILASPLTANTTMDDSDRNVSKQSSKQHSSGLHSSGFELWLAENPAKRAGELFMLKFSAYWISLVVVVVGFRLFEVR